MADLPEIFSGVENLPRPAWCAKQERLLIVHESGAMGTGFVRYFHPLIPATAAYPSVRRFTAGVTTLFSVLRSPNEAKE